MAEVITRFGAIVLPFLCRGYGLESTCTPPPAPLPSACLFLIPLAVCQESHVEVGLLLELLSQENSQTVQCLTLSFQSKSAKYQQQRERERDIHMKLALYMTPIKSKQTQKKNNSHSLVEAILIVIDHVTGLSPTLLLHQDSFSTTARWERQSTQCDIPGQQQPVNGHSSLQTERSWH